MASESQTSVIWPLITPACADEGEEELPGAEEPVDTVKEAKANLAHDVMFYSECVHYRKLAQLAEWAGTHGVFTNRDQRQVDRKAECVITKFLASRLTPGMAKLTINVRRDAAIKLEQKWRSQLKGKSVDQNLFQPVINMSLIGPLILEWEKYWIEKQKVQEKRREKTPKYLPDLRPIKARGVTGKPQKPMTFTELIKKLAGELQKGRMSNQRVARDLWVSHLKQKDNEGKRKQSTTGHATGHPEDSRGSGDHHHITPLNKTRGRGPRKQHSNVVVCANPATIPRQYVVGAVPANTLSYSMFSGLTLLVQDRETRVGEPGVGGSLGQKGVEPGLKGSAGTVATSPKNVNRSPSMAQSVVNGRRTTRNSTYKEGRTAKRGPVGLEAFNEEPDEA